jgi:hypothetical protein
MSPRCTDGDVGKLLHPYELGHLSESERDRFESHLLACDHCARELETFERPAEVLVSSVDVRALATEYAQERTSYLSRLKQAFWPQERLVLRPALAWGLVVLLIFPAYLGLRSGGMDVPTPATTILLTGTRSVSVPPTSGNRPVVLYFRVPGHRAGTVYEISLESESGELVHRDDTFSAIDDREMGTLLLPAERIGSGQYRLGIRGTDGTQIYEYSFTVQ